MAEENAQSAAGEGGKSQDPAVEAQPRDTEPEEGGKPQDPGDVEGNDRTPNVHKLERDVANRDKTIAELKAKLAEKEKGGSDFEAHLAALEKQASDSKAEADAVKADAKLAAAGCVDCDLTRAVLGDFDGDVAKLKEAKPYPFAPQGGSKGTGGRVSGTSDGPCESIRDALAQTDR